jgi:hypothetical protein
VISIRCGRMNTMNRKPPTPRRAFRQQEKLRQAERESHNYACDSDPHRVLPLGSDLSISPS